ncbi:hypothetical protein BDK62_10469 [Halomonas alkaliantarctica]|nr:hypothetical protein BDK62_10469 [Halomonas alkaliantarctica]
MSNDDGKKAVVAKVINDYEVVINKGLIHGVKINDKYLIFGIGDDIIDPDTKENLGKLEVSRGTGRVVYVQEKIATIRSDAKEKGKVVRKSKRPNPHSLYSLARSLREDDTEEIVEEHPERDLPFDYPEAGDRAKYIGRS